ncbi:MAG: hypothetical protein KF898_07110 [Parachlamydiales bacterium]|nr:hypothetical protein [Verrucomicrobiota bacterium]MBX3719399.1 hypothetical protein [Candidatus Acheromyda pituitae]
MHRACTSQNIGYGVLSGLIGGFVFAVLMAYMGVISRISELFGIHNAIGGFFTHWIFSLIISVIFALVFFRLASTLLTSTIWGLLYGILWWFLGPLTILSAIIGKPIGTMWNVENVKIALPGLYGHIVYGLIMGFTYGWLRSRAKKRK